MGTLEKIAKGVGLIAAAAGTYILDNEGLSEGNTEIMADPRIWTCYLLTLPGVIYSLRRK